MRAIIYLAQTKTPVSAHDLAIAENLPEDFLEKILQKLKKAGIVHSKKGHEGGYFLARAPKDITAWDTVSLLDAPFRHIAVSTPKGTLPCLVVSHCQANEVWRILEAEIKKTLSEITIDSLTR